MSDTSTPSQSDQSDRSGDTGESAAMPVDQRREPKKSFKRRHWGKLTLLFLFGLPAAVLAIWTAVALNFSYSDGKRDGYVQKMSRKGWACKTWEGTLYTGIAKSFQSDSFQFTVRSDSIAELIQSYAGKKVAVDYKQHIGVPLSCFGDTEYFVTGVSTLPE